jgi:hypothetical protein
MTSVSEMALSPAELIAIDREHLVHPLHHPIDHSDPIIYVRGHGAVGEVSHDAARVVLGH